MLRSIRDFKFPLGVTDFYVCVLCVLEMGTSRPKDAYLYKSGKMMDGWKTPDSFDFPCPFFVPEFFFFRDLPGTHRHKHSLTSLSLTLQIPLTVTPSESSIELLLTAGESNRRPQWPSCPVG